MHACPLFLHGSNAHPHYATRPQNNGGDDDWHQDWSFYPHTNYDLLAVGIYLEDCFDENGPLKVLPRSHKGKLFDHHYDGNLHSTGNCGVCRSFLVYTEFFDVQTIGRESYIILFCFFFCILEGILHHARKYVVYGN